VACGLPTLVAMASSSDRLGTINLVTVDREYRCGGSDIARRLAERLGWRLWDEQLTLEIARRMKCECSVVEMREERRDPKYYRILKAFLRGSAEDVRNLGRWRTLDADCINEIAGRVVMAAASEGRCVIVGRGSAYSLRHRSDAFHVFVYAPVEEKIRRMQRSGEIRQRAIKLIETVDHDRAAFIWQYFHREWPDRQLFHLMVNSAVGDSAAVETILCGLRSAEQQAS
jgi:cytidylate kinase